MNTHRLITLVAAAIATVIIARQGNSQSPNDASQTEPGEPQMSVISSIRGSVIPIRSAESETGKPTVHSIETFRDEDFGTLTMVSSSGGIATIPHPKSFDIRVAHYEGGVQVVRFMPRLGTVWIMDEGEWITIQEPSELFPGDYDIQMALHGEGLDVVRLERLTGTTWMLADTGWIEIREPEGSEQ